MKLKCVSRFWSSLISSRYFTNIFFNFSSSTKQRRVFVYEYDYMLFSSSLSNLDTTTSFVQLNRDMTLPCIKKDCLQFVNALRGLMCFRVGREIRIINFSTRQVLSLPLVESNLLESDYSDVWYYFGYNSVNDEYKVLSIISSTDETNELRSKTQVFVLGDGSSWRNTKSLTFSPPPHDPHEGISINGILYYGAWSHEERTVLMSFDFNSEETNLIELPFEYRIKWIDLIYYQDQVAVFDDSRLKTECILDLWVLEDVAKSKWSHKVLVLPCHQIGESLELKLELEDEDEDEDIDDLYIRGTSRSGEVTLCGKSVNRINRSSCAFYDLEKNRITRGFVIDPPYPRHDFYPMNLWEDVESITYLEA